MVEMLYCQDVGNGVVGYIRDSGECVVGYGIGVIVGCFVVVCGRGGVVFYCYCFGVVVFMNRVAE